ncbi:hypothetical protein M404DRAFT_168200, partial [Pisolithus tinctorius Marx 270]
YDSWTTLMPTIIEPYLQYSTETIRKPLVGCDTPISGCHGHCNLKHSSLLCLYFNCVSLTITFFH